MFRSSTPPELAITTPKAPAQVRVNVDLQPREGSVGRVDRGAVKAGHVRAMAGAWFDAFVVVHEVVPRGVDVARVHTHGDARLHPLHRRPDQKALDGGVPAMQRQFETNVFALVGVTRALFPVLRRAKGLVVNIGSVSGVLVTPFAGAYCASKAYP